MEKKMKVILTVAVVLVVVITSFFTGFFVSANYFSAGRILHGTKDNLIGSWATGIDSNAVITFYQNGSFSSGSGWGTFQVVGDKLITTDSNNAAVGTFYFIDGYNKLALEIQPSNPGQSSSSMILYRK